jgi:Family of unknown function (DUF6131)
MTTPSQIDSGAADPAVPASADEGRREHQMIRADRPATAGLAGTICGSKRCLWLNSRIRYCVSGEIMIAIGIILLIIGFVTGIAILWTIGIIVLVLGLIAMLFGMTGHAIGGRRHYW